MAEESNPKTEGREDTTSRLREEEAWADVLPGRQVEQEVLDILDL